MTEQLAALPSTIAAGTTVVYTKAVPDYLPADGWTLKLYIRGAVTLNKTATVSGTSYVVTLTSTDTATLSAGGYRWAEQVEKAGTPLEVHEIDRGELLVELNLATAAANDALTYEEKTLAVIEAKLSGRLTADMESYQIAGRAVSRIPVKELEALRDKYRLRVYQQRNGGKFSRTLRVEFPSVS